MADDQLDKANEMSYSRTRSTPEFRKQRVEVAIKDVTIETATRFMYNLEKPEEHFTVEEIALAVDRDDPYTWSGKFRMSRFVKPEKSAPAAGK